MGEVVRDPDRLFWCPRCGLPVTYKGRGRRPVWCSARCRVEASIERRGNRMVGVEPRVVTVVPPMKRLSQWEMGRRQQIEEKLNRDTVITMVAREPYLLVKVLALVEEQGLSGSEAARQIVAQGLTRTARAVAPEAVEPAVLPAQSHIGEMQRSGSRCCRSSGPSSPTGSSTTGICSPLTSH